MYVYVCLKRVARFKFARAHTDGTMMQHSQRRGENTHNNLDSVSSGENSIYGPGGGTTQPQNA